MKKQVLLITSISLLFLAGCRGKQGENGVQGARGPGRIQVLSGAVTSNDFFVTDTDISQATQVNVYINAGGQLLQIPIFNTTGGFNVLYALSGSSIEVINASMGGASSYTIVLILP